MKTIFLAGSTGRGHVDWRKQYYSLSDFNIFNPIVSVWTDLAKQREKEMRESADILLFTINGNNCYSIAELVDCSNKRPDATIGVFDYAEIARNESINMASANAIRELAEQNGAKIFVTHAQCIEYLKTIA